MIKGIFALFTVSKNVGRSILLNLTIFVELLLLFLASEPVTLILGHRGEGEAVILKGV